MRGLIAQGAAALTALLLAAPVSAQQSDGDWAHYAEESAERGKECWAVSEPTSTVNTRDGAVVTVSRGEILLFVFYRPDAGVQGQVTFTGGYPFADGSTAELTIGGETFQLFTEGEWAWPPPPRMTPGSPPRCSAAPEAVMVARSGRGTTTQDTFSLLGFTAMNQAAQAACAGS